MFEDLEEKVELLSESVMELFVEHPQAHCSGNHLIICTFFVLHIIFISGF